MCKASLLPTFYKRNVNDLIVQVESQSLCDHRLLSDPKCDSAPRKYK